MLSATDPVAVVAVLQEVGASQKLTCVIDGESLMNDGSALVIFLLLQKIVNGQPVTVGGGIAQFCLLAVVGMLLGIAFGAATSWLLENICEWPGRGARWARPPAATCVPVHAPAAAPRTAHAPAAPQGATPRSPRL
jgi:NhaP-type Na+/H+ or K+/H+ antiporter